MCTSYTRSSITTHNRKHALLPSLCLPLAIILPSSLSNGGTLVPRGLVLQTKSRPEIWPYQYFYYNSGHQSVTLTAEDTRASVEFPYNHGATGLVRFTFRYNVLHRACLAVETKSHPVALKTMNRSPPLIVRWCGATRSTRIERCLALSSNSSATSRSCSHLQFSHSRPRLPRAR